MTTNFKYAQLQPFSLAGSGSALGDITLVLTSFTDIDGDLLTMSDFGIIGYGTIEPGTLGREEQISFTGVTQNANGTATLTGISSVGDLFPYTKTSGIQKTHPGGVVFVISNTAGFYNELTSRENDETINGTWSFIAVPNAPDPVSGTDVANKQYVLSVVNGGTITTDQLIVVATAGETLTAGESVYLKSDARWYKTIATDSTTVTNVIIGISQGTGTSGFAITGGVLVEGTDKTQSGLTLGTVYYVSDTPGAISSSPGTISVVLGQAKSTTELYFNTTFRSLPTSSQKDAMAGGGSLGIPSSSNKFQTQVGISAILSPVFNVYTSSTTWTKPTGLKYIVVEVLGGGGGGSFSANPGTGAGGGSAGYAKKLLTASVVASTVAVTVGAAGAGNNPGSNGGQSKFNHTVAVIGNPGGGANSTTPGTGGTATGGDLNINGQQGQKQYQTTVGGAGASSIYGQGGWQGVAASGYGAGGGGDGGGSPNPSDGSAGLVLVTEYYI